VVQDDAEAVNVVEVVHGGARRLLGGDVGDVVDAEIAAVAGGVETPELLVEQQFGNAEIHDLDAFFAVRVGVDDDVLGCEIAVFDEALVGLVEGVGDLVENVDRPFLLQRRLRLEDRGQRTSLDELRGDEVALILGHVHVVDGADVDVLQLGILADGLAEQRVEFFIAGQSGLEDLQNDRPAQRHLLGLEDAAEAVLADHLRDLVFAVQGLVDQGVLLLDRLGQGGAVLGTEIEFVPETLAALRANLHGRPRRTKIVTTWRQAEKLYYKCLTKESGAVLTGGDGSPRRA